MNEDSLLYDAGNNMILKNYFISLVHDIILCPIQYWNVFSVVSLLRKVSDFLGESDREDVDWPFYNCLPREDFGLLRNDARA